MKSVVDRLNEDLDKKERQIERLVRALEFIRDGVYDGRYGNMTKGFYSVEHDIAQGALQEFNNAK